MLFRFNALFIASNGTHSRVARLRRGPGLLSSHDSGPARRIVAGVCGYDNLFKILKNRKHPEHKTMKEWMGQEFDAAAFDVGKTNLWLRKLKWPRVTEAQLRKVLMGRDDYEE